jgi:small subunit ribosomal protein S8
MTDSIADMLTRIRNAQSAEKASVSMPASRVKAAIAQVLKDEGYVADWRRDESQTHPQLVVDLKYYEGDPVIEKLTRVSRPGRRVYAGRDELPSINGGLGIAIVSTSRGIMTDRAARAAGTGGEVLCTVY